MLVLDIGSNHLPILLDKNTNTTGITPILGMKLVRFKDYTEAETCYSVGHLTSQRILYSQGRAYAASFGPRA